MKKNTQKTAQKSLTNLVKLGLTPDEAKTYTLLLTKGSQTAASIANSIGVLPNAIYRLAKKLKNKGFIVFLDTTPTKYQVIPPSVAIKAFYEQSRAQLTETTYESISLLSGPTEQNPQTRIDTVISQAEVFSRFVELTKKVKKEVLVISIGETVPDEVKLVIRDAKERGANVKLMFHIYNQENESIIKSWIKMGIEVRHSPGWGYHLMLFDRKISFLVANNPDETAERTGMVIYSQSLAKVHRDYFFSLWENANIIK